MTDHKPTPHHVYDEATNLDSFSVSRTGLLRLVRYAWDVREIPLQGSDR